MISRIIEFIDTEINLFCSQNSNYNIYRVGSSLFHDQLNINDIDLVVIDTNSIINYSKQIENFKKKFSDRNFLKSTIDTFDKQLDVFFISLEYSIFFKYGIKLIHRFGFGPIAEDDCLSLHIAGPMNVESTNLFYQEYPIFHLVFDHYNKRLGTKEFSELITKQNYNDFEIEKAIRGILFRSNNTMSINIKRQCLNRINLITLIYQKHPSPYIEAFNIVSSLQDIEVVKELMKYK